MKKTNWRLIKGIIKTDLAIIGIFALFMYFINWVMSLPGHWTAIVLGLTIISLANIATYYALNQAGFYREKEWQPITDDELLSACKDCDHGFNISGFQQGALWADKVLKRRNKWE